jgi:AcrR family transcriptional regulator
VLDEREALVRLGPVDHEADPDGSEGPRLTVGRPDYLHRGCLHPSLLSLNVPFIESAGTLSWLNTMSSEKRPYRLRARADRQRETRRRIVEATVELHGELGPARTTIAEIARRAGVQRLTVYNHFPTDTELFAACSGHYMAEHPWPDLGPALALDSPAERVFEALRIVYERYRETQQMTSKVLRDRELMPAIDERVKTTVDAPLAELADRLAGALAARGPERERGRALLRVALDFFTWRLLERQGLDDRAKAELMRDAIVCAVSGVG